MPRKPIKSPVVTLIVLALTLTACALPQRPQAPAVVPQAEIPPLPPQARQPPVPAMCSPTCSAGWARLVQSLRQKLTGGE